MPTEDASRGGELREPDRVRLINRIVGGRYEVLETVGDGPLLMAFRARDRQMNRIVTLKVVRSEFASRPPLLDLLRQGFSETLTLNQPSIARSYDIGSDAELAALYHVEEFVRGIDLKERIRRAAPFQLNSAVDIALALAEALEYTHLRGIPHGDLCPQNVLVGPEGQVKLTGFGVASAYRLIAADDPSLLLRAVHYMAPDQATGAMPLASADLYSLAVLLFEMLTGDTPFHGDNAIQVALRNAQEAPPSPRTLNQAVPRALEGVILKGLGKRPQDRYSDATALLEDLRHIREALRFGHSLAWSPMDSLAGKTTATVKPPAEPTPADVAVMPTSRNETMRRTSQPIVPTPKAVPADTKEEPVPPRRTGGILLAINLFLLVALIGASALVFTWIRPFLNPATDVIVPELKGKTLTEAQALANERQFKLVVVSKSSRDDLPNNTIFQQKEVPGSRIREGREIAVWVSLGPDMVVLPNVEQMTLDKAQKELEKPGFRVGAVTRKFDSITPVGVVLEQLPRGDGVERRPKGTKIDLTISKGPEPEPTPTPEPSPTPVPKDSGTGTDDPALPDPDDMKQKTFRFSYKPLQDGKQHRIVVQVEDSEGTHVGYDKEHGPGQKIPIEVSGVGRPIIIKLYDNDELKALENPVKGK